MCIHVHESISNLLSCFYRRLSSSHKNSSCNTYVTILMYNPRTLQISSFCMYSYSYKPKRYYDEPYSRKQNIKEETAKTTRKSSLYFIPREQRFDPWRLVLRRLERYPALRQEIRMRSPPLDLPQTDFHLKYENLARYR